MTRTLPHPPATDRTKRAGDALDVFEALYARIDEALARLDTNDGDRTDATRPGRNEPDPLGDQRRREALECHDRRT